MKRPRLSRTLLTIVLSLSFLVAACDEDDRDLTDGTVVTPPAISDTSTTIFDGGDGTTTTP